MIKSPETGMAKVTQKIDHHSTCQESSFKTPSIYTTTFFFFCMYLDLHSNMLSLGSKISEAYWSCVFVTDSRKKKECLLEILNYNMPSPGLSSIWDVGLGADLSQKDSLCVLEPFCPAS